MTAAGTVAVADAQGRAPPALRRLVSGTLRVGVGVAGVLLAVGTALSVVEGSPRYDRATAFGTAFSLRALGGSLASAEPVAFLQLGLIVLVVTPLVRVVISAVEFSAARDRAFTALTLAVLALLVLSVVVSAVA